MKKQLTLFVPGLQVRFKHESESDAFAGRTWNFLRQLPDSRVELVTPEGDISCTADKNNIEPDFTMETYARTLVMKGKGFSIDFLNRTLKVDGRRLIENGKACYPLQLTDELLPFDKPNDTLLQTLESIENLYAKFKHSIPSKNDTAHPSKYFLALKEDDLSNEDMMYGLPRNVARFNLEYFVLCKIIEGALVWDASVFGDTWFWQSLKDKSLVILKNWIEQ